MQMNALVLLAGALFLAPLEALACSASNETGEVCSITCEPGQAEICINAAGGGAPECMCSGTPSESSSVAKLLGNLQVKNLSIGQLASGAEKTLTLTDVAAVFSEFLTKYGPVPVTRYHTENRAGPERCRQGFGDPEIHPPICNPTTTEVQVAVTTNETLRFTNVSVVSRTDISFGPPKFQNFPDQLVANYKTILNCSHVPSTPNPSLPSSSVNLQVSVTRTNSVAFSQSFTHGGSISANGGVSVGVVRFGASITVSESETTGTATTNSEADTVTASGTANYAEPWRMKSLVGITAYKVATYVPFQFTATLDADLSPNDKNLTKLSQILDLDKRTFVVQGALISNAVSDGNIVYYDPQPVEENDCTRPGVTIQDVGLNLDEWMLASKPIPEK
jgi:hypothetical protein